MSPLNGVLSEAWDLYRRFAGHFLLISFVIYLITAVLVALLSLGKIPGAIIGDIISFGASILAGIGIAIGFILLIVPGLILLTFWCLIIPFIVLGNAGVFEAFGNSMRTVRGYAWRVFGTYVLVFLILIAFGIVFGIVLRHLPVSVRTFVNSIVTGTLIAPFLALVATLIYYRLTAAHAG